MVTGAQSQDFEAARFFTLHTLIPWNEKVHLECHCIERDDWLISTNGSGTLLLGLGQASGTAAFGAFGVLGRD